LPTAACGLVPRGDERAPTKLFVVGRLPAAHIVDIKSSIRVLDEAHLPPLTLDGNIIVGPGPGSAVDRSPRRHRVHGLNPNLPDGHSGYRSGRSRRRRHIGSGSIGSRWSVRLSLMSRPGCQDLLLDSR